MGLLQGNGGVGGGRGGQERKHCVQKLKCFEHWLQRLGFSVKMHPTSCFKVRSGQTITQTMLGPVTTGHIGSFILVQAASWHVWTPTSALETRPCLLD